MMRALLNSHAVWLTPMLLKAFLLQLKDFSSTVDAKITISGKVEAIIPDIPAMRISFWTFALIF
jgi:hypothetical protein